MTRVLITGAAGFVGQALARRLADDPTALGAGLERLVLVDRSAPAPAPAIGLVQWLEGDLAEPGFAARMAAERCDVVFHLASLPGGQAERERALGRRVNLDATLDLFDALGAQPAAGGAAPVVVFASSIAVYGSGLAAQVDPATPLRPAMTYGAHKAMAEIALADATRRGLLDGRSLRLPGIVARPRGPAGQTSAFMSALLHAVAAGEPIELPVSPDATAWWMSARCAVDNLLHAARMDSQGRDRPPAWQLPVLHARMDEVVGALAERFGNAHADRVRYRAVPAIEAVFGRYPALDDSAARALGFVDDGSLAQLIAHALEGTPPPATETP